MFFNSFVKVTSACYHISPTVNCTVQGFLSEQQLWTHHHNTFLKYFCHSQKVHSCLFAGSSHSQPSPRQTSFSASRALHFKEISCNGIAQDVVFCVWRLSLSITPLGFIPVVAYMGGSFFLLPSSVCCIDRLWLSIHQPGHVWTVSSFRLLYFFIF